MANRTLKIALGGLGLALVLAAALLLAAWFYAGSQSGLSLARDLARAQAAKALEAELRIESLEGNPLTSLVAKGVSLTRQGRVLARAEELELSLNPLAMLGGRLRLGRLRLIRPEIDLPLELARPEESPATASLALTISSLEVQEGALRAGGQLGPVESLEGVDLKAGLTLDSRGLLLDLNLARARARLSGTAKALEISGEAEMQGQHLRVKALAIASGGNRLAGEGDLEWAKAPRLALSGRAEINQVRDLPWAWPSPWPGGNPPSAPIALEVRAQGGLEQADISANLGQGGGSLEIKGQLNWLGRVFKGRGRLANLDLAALGLSPWPTKLGGGLEIEAAGERDRLLPRSARLSLDLDQVSLAGQPGQRAGLRAAWEKGLLSVSALEIKAPWGSLEGSGQAAWSGPAGQPPEIKASLAFSELGAPPALLPAWLAQARLRGRLEARGQPADLALELNLEPSPLLPGLELGHLAARGGLREGAWRLESLECAAPGLEVSAQGRADAAGADLGFSLRAERIQALADPLRAAGLELPSPWTGAVSAQGRLQGPWSGPGLSVRAQAKELELPWASAGEADLQLDTPRLALPAQGQLKLTVQRHQHGDWYFYKAQVEAQAGPGGSQLQASAQGPALRTAFRLSGPSNPALPLELRLEGLALALAGRASWQQTGRAGLSLGPNGLAVQGLSLAQGPQRLELDAGLSQKGDLSGNLVLAGIKLDPWLPKPGLAPKATLEAQVRLGGSLSAPTLSLRGKIADLDWAQLPPSEVSFQGGYQDGQLTLQGQALTRGAPSMEMNASLGLDLTLGPPLLHLNQRGLHLRVRAHDQPLALLEPALPMLSGVGGLLDLELGAEGSLESPQLSGHLALKNGAFTINATSQSFSEVNARFRLEGRDISVERFELASGGPVRLAGRLVLPIGGPGMADLSLEARQFRLSLAALGEVVLDARLKLAGDLERPLLTGMLTPRRAIIQPRLATPSIMDDVVVLGPGQQPPPVRRERRQAPRIAPAGLLGRLAIDVKMEMTPDLKVRVGEGFLEMLGLAEVRKEPGGALIYYGGSKVPRGVIIVQGKRFEISDGSTDLAGKDRPDPDLKALASMRVGNALILVNVSGTSYDTVLNFSSEPPMSQADILSTIIFGRPVASLSAGESRELSAQALALMGQRGKREIERLLGPALAPDVVTVHTEAQTGSSLEAGKYLSQDLYLRYRRNLGPEGGENVGLELRLNPYLSLESQVGTTRDNGVDVIFSYDFD